MVSEKCLPSLAQVDNGFLILKVMVMLWMMLEREWPRRERERKGETLERNMPGLELEWMSL